MMDHISRSA